MKLTFLFWGLIFAGVLIFGGGFITAVLATGLAAASSVSLALHVQGSHELSGKSYKELL